MFRYINRSILIATITTSVLLGAQPAYSETDAKEQIAYSEYAALNQNIDASMMLEMAKKIRMANADIRGIDATSPTWSPLNKIVWQHAAARGLFHLAVINNNSTNNTLSTKERVEMLQMAAVLLFCSNRPNESSTVAALLNKIVKANNLSVGYIVDIPGKAYKFKQIRVGEISFNDVGGDEFVRASFDVDSRIVEKEYLTMANYGLYVDSYSIALPSISPLIGIYLARGDYDSALNAARALMTTIGRSYDKMEYLLDANAEPTIKLVLK